MNNSSVRRPPRTYAPRSTVMTKRIPIGIDPISLARCKERDAAQNKTDAAYVLEVYLEGQAHRRHHGGAGSALDAK
jgi:hypothetical protein